MKLLQVKQVAEMLAVTPRTVRTKIKQGSLPVVHVAGLTRIDAEMLQDIISLQLAQYPQALAQQDRQAPPKGEAQ